MRRRLGNAFRFFSAVVGWMGVFLTGSDTSANALFGNLQLFRFTFKHSVLLMVVVP